MRKVDLQTRPIGAGKNLAQGPVIVRRTGVANAIAPVLVLNRCEIGGERLNLDPGKALSLQRAQLLARRSRAHVRSGPPPARPWPHIRRRVEERLRVEGTESSCEARRRTRAGRIFRKGRKRHLRCRCCGRLHPVEQVGAQPEEPDHRKNHREHRQCDRHPDRPHTPARCPRRGARLGLGLADSSHHHCHPSPQTADFPCRNQSPCDPLSFFLPTGWFWTYSFATGDAPVVIQK